MSQPSPAESLARSIVRRLRDGGHRAWYAGGCVRDRLMGNEPKDFDVATSAKPEEIQALFERTVAVGARFGVIVVVGGEEQVEVATFRAEGGYTDGRHPDWVRYADEEADVLRRDFTVNGMLYDPIDDRLFDRVGGEEDIRRRVIRTIGDPRERFREDRLRLIRAVRFAARLDFAITDETAEAIRSLAGEISSVSWERIRDELLKILGGPNPRRGMELLHSVGLLAPILPEVAAMDGVEQPPEFHPEGDVLHHTLLLLDHLDAPSDRVALAALLHDIGKPPTFEVADRIRFNRHDTVGAGMADEVCRRLHLSNRDREAVVDLVGSHMKFAAVRDMRESTLKRFLRKEDFEDHLALHRADCLASHGMLDNYEFCREKLEDFRAADREEALRPKPLLTGHDLKAWGLEPGPLFREILTALEDAQLEGLVADRDAAEAWVRERYAEHFS